MKGLKPYYPSAKAAYKDSIVITDTDPVPGSIVWFEGGFHGDCALALGGKTILALMPNGKPVLTTIDGYPSKYLGWSMTLKESA